RHPPKHSNLVLCLEQSLSYDEYEVKIHSFSPLSIKNFSDNGSTFFD
ncbi:hypothetical protein SOVF_182030, partial [Spinacia oleracea]